MTNQTPINHNSRILINKIVKNNKIKDYKIFNSKYVTGLPMNATQNLDSVTILLIQNVNDKQKMKIIEQIRFWYADNIEILCKRKTNIINPFWQFGIKYRNNFCLKVHGIIIGFEGDCGNEGIFCEIFDENGLSKKCSFVLKLLADKEVLKIVKKEDVFSDEVLFSNFN